MAQSAGALPDRVVWEDENWVLVSDGGATETPVSLALHLREHEGLGHLDDEFAAQLGRITNRLIRIIENLPGAGRVEVGRLEVGRLEVGRNPGTDVGVWFRSRPAEDGGRLADDHLHTIAEKLANWGGAARA